MREDGSRRLYDELLGTSDQMREVRELVGRVADTDVTVLVRGESGTGKELVARAVHDASPRRERTFVKVNCAALPAELLESELFGFERGAFTGAIQHKPGKFEFRRHDTPRRNRQIGAPPQSAAAVLRTAGSRACGRP
jgi:two-component system response regulator AtoC